MADLIIEDVSDETVALLGELALARGMSIEDVAKTLLDAAAAEIRGAKD